MTATTRPAKALATPVPVFPNATAYELVLVEHW